jgi:hypothetical protein
MAFAPGSLRGIWIPVTIPLFLLPIVVFFPGSTGWIAIMSVNAICAAWAVIAARQLAVRTARGGAGRYLSRIRIFYLAAIVAFGVGPIIAQSLAIAIANALGCYANEHGVYTHGLPSDTIGCQLGRFELSGVLHPLYMSALLLIVTWPFTVATIVTALVELATWIRGRPSRAG